MSAEANKQLIRDYVAAFNAGDLEGLRRLHGPEAVIRGVLGWAKIDDALPIWRELMNALGLQLKIEDLVVEGDRVAARLTETGTFRAPFRGRDPTGGSYEIVAMEWYVIEGGLIQQRWGARDSASLWSQVEASA